MQSSSLVLVVLLSFFMGNVIGFQSSFKSSSTKNNVQRKINSLNMKIFDQFDALLFDCDGVIAETERDVHRISFNQAFKHKGLENEWDVDLYGKLLKIGGGKERMTGRLFHRLLICN